MTEFQKWFFNFLDSKEIDVAMPIKFGDGTDGVLGDVIAQIVTAGPHEQNKIRQQMIKITHKGQHVADLLAAYAGAMNESHRMNK